MILKDTTRSQTKLVGLFFQNRCFRISHQNPRLIHLQRDSKNFFLKLNFFTDTFQEFRSKLLQ